MNLSNINLQKGEDGRFILSKEAAAILRKANSITVSYDSKIKTECYLLAEIDLKKYGSEFQMYYKMPINVLEQKFRFRTCVINHFKHVMQEVIKNQSILIFMPSQDGLQDTIRFIVHNDKKIVRGIFTQKNAKNENDHLRLVSVND